MKAEFSEFSYGFALSYEIMNALRPDIVGAPLFPSLREEGEKGIDVSFEPAGLPLFLQFKLADYMTRPHAKYWSDYGKRFFRMAIRRRKYSNQHNLLRALSAREPEVYYATPAFYLQSEFNRAFTSDRILTDSQFFPLSELPDVVDDEPHYITYCRGMPGFHWHSEDGKYFEAVVSGEVWLGRLKRQALEPRRLGEEFFVDLRTDLAKLIKEHTLQPRLFHDELPINLDDVTPLTVIRDLRYLLVTYFGVETIILRPKSQ